MAAARPEPFQHKGDEVVALLQHLLHFLVVGVVGLAIGLCPVQHVAVNAELGELRLEIAVIGPIAQSLVTVGHRPVTGVLRGKFLTGDRLDQHGGSRRAAAGAADSGVLALDPIRLVFPARIGLQIGNRFLIHHVTLSNVFFCAVTH